MVKYRFLTDEELKELEEEFKQFLITNHLYAEEWKKLNTSNPEKAKEVVGLFSDLVLEKVYSKTEYLIHIAGAKLKAFKFYDAIAEMIALDLKNGGEIPKENTVEFIQNNLDQFLIFSANKRFDASERNKEVFSLVKAGAEKCDSFYFDALKKLV